MTTPKSGSYPGALSRTSSESSVQRPLFDAASVQTESDSSLNSPGACQKQDRDSVGDAYAQEIGFGPDDREMPAEQHQGSPFLSPSAQGTAGANVPLKREVSIGVSHTDTSTRTSIPDLSYLSLPGTQRRGFMDPISAAQLSRIRDQSSASYPSPTDSSVDSPPLPPPNAMNYNYASSRRSLLDSQMPPPLQNSRSFSSYSSSSRQCQEEFPRAGEHRTKRMRLSPPRDTSDSASRNPMMSFNNYNECTSKTASSYSAPQLLSFHSYSPSNSYSGVALSPFSSSDNIQTLSADKPSAQIPQESPDLRRLSVSSLLSPPDEDEAQGDSGGSITPTSPYIESAAQAPSIPYGLDRGFPDLDWPNNNDAIALNGLTPSLSTVGLYYSETESTADDPYIPPEFGFGLHAAQGEGGYYAKPVAVMIPRSLGTLPSELQENPMNLLYFHHFLNHTARLLVPHDCPENPFTNILPQSMFLYSL